MAPYYTGDGNQITQADIEQAVKEQRAVIRWSHGNFVNIATLLVYPTADEAEDEATKDTRGECYSMADEVWSELATDMRRARKAAAGLLKVS